MSGSSTPNDHGNYTAAPVGTASILLSPSARPFPSFWIDSSSRLVYIFGGTPTSELWKWDGNLWTLLDMGVRSPIWNGTTPNPGSRVGFSTWAKDNGFYLFSGYNTTATSTGYVDIWRLDVVDTMINWTWVYGPNTLGPSPVYGAQGVASPLNRPAFRIFSPAAVVSGQFVAMFGGAGAGNIERQMQ